MWISKIANRVIYWRWLVVPIITSTIVFLIGEFVSLNFALSIGTAAILLTVLYTLLQLYRKQKVDSCQHHRQIEATIALYTTLKPRLPLPLTTGAAISPDLGLFVVREIFARKPKLMLELGSGTSTLLSGYALSRLGGHLISIEHDETYAEQIKEELANHGLSEYVEVRYAPLATVPIGNEKYSWYDPEVFSDLRDIELVVVDGPPGRLHPRARYPVVPILIDRLAGDCQVIFDDANRTAEKQIITDLSIEFGMAVRWIKDMKKGSAILKRGEFRQPLSDLYQ